MPRDIIKLGSTAPRALRLKKTMSVTANQILLVSYLT
jgi:hypothetical protein